MFVIYTKVRMLRVLNLQDNDPERHVDLPKWTQKDPNGQIYILNDEFLYYYITYIE